jgi:hypothetical protein
MKKSLITLVGAAALAIVGSGIANASITVALDSSAGGVYKYGISVDSLESLTSGSYFTIYDFAGYVANSAVAPGGWTVSEALTGLTPGTVIVPDSASIINLTFTYTGATTSGPINNLPGFNANSTDTGSNNILGWFTYQAEKTQTTTIDQGDGNLEVPGATSTPEPISMSLLGGGLALLGMLRLRPNK